MMKTREVDNYLKAVFFERPEWIPCSIGLPSATWMKYRNDLDELVMAHRALFPDYREGRDFDAVDDRRYEAGEFTDNWGCRWRNIARGLDGLVVGSPLESWDAFEAYRAPDPIHESDGWAAPPDWDALAREFDEVKARGGLATGGLPHGFLYMRLCDLRGFENLMVDVATDEPKLRRLIDMVLEYNLAQIGRILDAGAERVIFGDDLGLQNALAISPDKFRQILKPCYMQMLGLCRERGAIVYFHSDGHILPIIPDLVEMGVNVLNPQVGANTLDGLREVAKGKVCIHLDLDRQLFPFASPDEIVAHVHEAVEVLRGDDGGLMLYAECEPDVPLATIEALCDAFEQAGGPLI